MLSSEVVDRHALVIWDEALMAHHHVFEAVDQSFHDLIEVVDLDAKNKIFRGQIMVLRDDFRQILSRTLTPGPGTW